MKKRLHDKKAGIVILAVLLITSLAYVILRATVYSDIPFAEANHGDALITMFFSVLLLVFAHKGKDRVFYILCGVWLSYFVMEQLFYVPFMISSFDLAASTIGTLRPMLALMCRLLGMVCIMVIGGLLVEYMIDGTIYNKAFNVFCIAAVLTFAASACIDIVASFSAEKNFVILSALNSLSNIIMIFLFTFFAYDSAKAQLEKTNLSK